MRYLFLLFIFTHPVWAQVRNVESALSFFEKNSITIDRGRTPANCENCDNERDEHLDLNFYREEPKSGMVESAEYKYGASFVQFQVKDGSGKRPTGFEFTMTGPNALAGKPLASCDDCKTKRHWQFLNKHGSKRETYIWITDDAGSGFLSQQMETVIVLLPRKNRPHLTETNEELHVTLTTGERVIFDKKTNLVRSGVFEEGPIDLNPNRHQRKFVPLKYTGKGISIRQDKRGEDPRTTSPRAIITQGNKTCEIPGSELWTTTAEFKFSDDSKLLQHINSKCAGKFSL